MPVAWKAAEAEGCEGSVHRGGRLGSPLALYLTAAGVGQLGIVDFDVVDYTNLQRQIIHTTADVGRKKLDSAADKLTAINPYLNLRTFDTKLTSAMRSNYFASSTLWRMAQTIFLLVIWSTMPACLLANPMFMDRFFASKARPASSPRKMDRAIAASIPSRRRPALFRHAPKAECWAFCLA